MSALDLATIVDEIAKAFRRRDTRRVVELNRLADQLTTPAQAEREAEMVAGIAANLRAVK